MKRPEAEAAPSAASSAECERLLGEQDRDRAVSLSFVPADRRADLSALYAFNIVTARVREQITTPLAGEMRLQWWRDQLLAPGGTTSVGHPVADALLAAIRRHDLPRSAFDSFLEARIFDLYDDPMPSRQAFEAYAGETASALIMLASMILDRGAAVEVADAAGHAGVAQAVAGNLRLLPIHRGRGQVYIPADILAAAGCDSRELLVGEKAASARAVVAMAAFGQEHFGKYKAASRLVPVGVRPAFLPAELAGLYLRDMARSPDQGLDKPTDLGPLQRSFAYWRAMRR